MANKTPKKYMLFTGCAEKYININAAATDAVAQYERDGQKCDLYIEWHAKIYEVFANASLRATGFTNLKIKQ